MEVGRRRVWNVDPTCMHKYMYVCLNKKSKDGRRSEVI